jgi:hypothetical protein
MKESTNAIFGPVLWFLVRATLESQPPLFQGSDFFAFGDTLALVIGLVGLASLINSVFAET